MSGDVENSQAMRDAERAAADLARALRVGATLVELDELMTVKANADERVASLRRRMDPVRGYTSGRIPADLLEQRRRLRAEIDDHNSPT